jgi:hypothetical protein
MGPPGGCSVVRYELLFPVRTGPTEANFRLATPWNRCQTHLPDHNVLLELHQLIYWLHSCTVGGLL